MGCAGGPVERIWNHNEWPEFPSHGALQGRAQRGADAMPVISNPDHPLGVFDSGVGGLTVVRQIVARLPRERVVYFGDTARVPYGTKSREAVIRFSKENIIALLHHKVKLVVIACNTATSWALEELRETFPLPMLGVIEPGARRAVQATRNRRIGVIATQSTVRSRAYDRHIQALARGVRVYSQACPLLVPLVEEGWLDHPVTRLVAAEYLRPLKRQKVDTLILGCTHYPLLKPLLQELMGPQVTLVDSAEEVARETQALLDREHLRRTRKPTGAHTFLVSDEPRHFAAMAQRFLGRRLRSVRQWRDA